MESARITSYLHELPPATQHFDLETLVSVDIDHGKEWNSHLTQWRELRGQHVCSIDLHESRPMIKGGSGAPPISNLKLRLRAVVTYQGLFHEALLLGAPADVTVALAEKLLDYLMLCFVRADKDTMNERLPQFQDFFDGAVKALAARSGTLPPENEDANHASVNTAIGLAFDHTTRVTSQSQWDDVDILRLDTSTSSSRVERWDYIIGNKKAKEALSHAVELKKHPHIRPNNANNVLLFGPPGTGKTMMVRSLAVMSGWTLFEASFMWKLQGESEKNLGRIYERAKQCSPSIIFFDDADGLMAARTANQSEDAGDISPTLLALLSDVRHTDTAVVTIATTSCPQDMDSAFLQRFSHRIYVPLPVVEDILQIMLTQIRNYDHDPYLDTSDGRHRLDLLAGKCMKKGRFKRFLSGDDIIQAIVGIAMGKIHRLLNTECFEERTLRDGEKVLLPCAPKEGAINISELDSVDRTRLNPITLADMKLAVSSVVNFTSADDIEDMEEWDHLHGTILKGVLS